jgi:TolB-like protein
MTALPEKPSVAVLPISNFSGDPEQEYERRRLAVAERRPVCDAL